MSKTAKWVLGILAALAFFFGMFLLLIFSWAFSVSEDETLSGSEGRVAVVELREPILSSEDIVRQLKKYREKRVVRAIVFRIESPGGGVAASQEIYEEVKKTRDGGKPVVVSMGSVAASGGYYIACGASRILANPGTLTGSIGVIFQFLHFNELMKKLGIDETTVKTGKFKDSGSPFRPTTEEEKKYFGLVIGDVYEQFVNVVSTERKLSKSYVKRYADGRVFTGRQAKEYGFVDSLGTFEDAVGLAAKLGGIEGKPKVVQERRRTGMLEWLLGERAFDMSQLKDDLLRQPVLQYKFTSPY